MTLDNRTIVLIIRDGHHKKRTLIMQAEIEADWHPADIVAAVHKKGASLARLARANGYTSGAALSNALRTPYPKAERLIADAIGVTPRDIWPSRYHSDGSPKSGYGERSFGFSSQYRATAEPGQQAPESTEKNRKAA